MDALVILKNLQKNKKKLEKLDETSGSSSMSKYGMFISILIGVYAAYISYDCNSKKNIPEIQKIVYSILAYIFGLIYLIYYFLFRFDSCNS